MRICPHGKLFLGASDSKLSDITSIRFAFSLPLATLRNLRLQTPSYCLCYESSSYMDCNFHKSSTNFCLFLVTTSSFCTVILWTMLLNLYCAVPLEVPFSYISFFSIGPINCLKITHFLISLVQPQTISIGH